MHPLGKTLLVSLLAAVPLAAQSDQACNRCHPGIHRDSLHGKMMQPATRQSVEGNFAQAKVVLHGSTYLLRESGGNYFITESDLSGKSWEHRIEYTLGVRRVQHYLTTLPDGRIVLIPAAWDNIAKKWIHDVDAGNPEEASGDRILVWNKTCYGCHATGERKNFDAATGAYHTTWQAPGVSCESCHGPGKEHAANPSKGNIVNPARLDATRGTMACAQCHSSRNLYADGFQAGGNYYDFYLPVLEYSTPASDDPAYWADGRPRWFANDAAGLWQSQCFLKGGANCATCHADRAPAGNASCAGCHKAIAGNVAAHTRHAPASAGSSCVECHMPAAVVGLKAKMRDHSIGIPAPENTVSHGVPNACNGCHQDKAAGWAATQMTAWWGGGSRQKAIRRADAFAGARQGKAAAIPLLLAIFGDSAEGGWMRANAIGWLGNFPDDPPAYAAVHKAFGDPDPLVRATASTALRPASGERAAVAADLVPLLNDPARVVRMNAAIALVGMGTKPFPGADGTRFEQAKQLYRERAALFADDAGQQYAAGRFFFLAGDLDGAVGALRASLKLAPATAAQYLLGRALAEKGDSTEALKVLQTIPAGDPAYQPAQTLLAQMAAKDPGAGARAQFLDGRLRYESHYYQAALNAFDQALAVAPQAEWAVRARIDRAICLEKLARTAEAESALQTLLGDPAARSDIDLQLAYVELLFDTGRIDEAGKRVDEAIAAAPNAAAAYFWRAKVRFQLGQASDAARAAEESVRLQPQLPEAHNLLIRIYQAQGRSKEAVEQAEWLRDYQRRTGSH